jgi:23S rRNA (guanosine2251-2'-O)-methyltransferase
VRLYGRHAVLAALGNPARRLRCLHATTQGLEIARPLLPRGLEVRAVDGASLGRLVGEEAPHQGLVLETEPLEGPHLDDLLSAATPGQPLLVLDHVTDPHNVGAILRSAAAFDAAAIITQDRHAPPETGALARAASGALDIMPWVRVVNLSRALEAIAEAGFCRVGLDGAAPTLIGAALGRGPTCLVLGAEGEGLRPNVASHCDLLARLPMSGRIESLNVSNAAAVALYAVQASQP